MSVLKKCPQIDSLIIITPGVQKLRAPLNSSKNPGPDAIPCRFLNELAQLAPVLTSLHNQSLAEGLLRDDWLQANVCPIFKNRNSYVASNYRPVSLTSVACNVSMLLASMRWTISTRITYCLTDSMDFTMSIHMKANLSQTCMSCRCTTMIKSKLIWLSLTFQKLSIWSPIGAS